MKARWLAVAFAAASIATLLPLPAGAQDDGADGPAAPAASDPWWPAPGAGPSAFGTPQAWSLRVPLRATVPELGGPEGTPAQVHLDLAQALLAAGWPATPGFTGPVLRSFTLDPATVRLVAYSPQWQVEDPTPVPALVQLGWLEPDQRARLGREQTTPFDAQRDPLLTVEWLLPEMAPGDEGLHYYLYLDIRENGERAAAEPDEAGQERLGGLYWMGAGTLLYGRNIGGNTLGIIAGEAGARVEVRVAKTPGAAFLRDQPLNGDPNPFDLAAGALLRYNVAGASDIQIVSDRPVVAFLYASSPTRMTPRGSGEFIPSLSGGLVGHHFVFPAFTANFDVMVPQVGGGVSASDAPDGSTALFCYRLLTPTTPVLDADDPCPAASTYGPVDPGDYVTIKDIQPTVGPSDGSAFKSADTRLEIRTRPGSGPVLVQVLPRDAHGATYQVPSTLGAPVGQRFLGAFVPTSGGQVVLQSWDEPVWGDILQPGRGGAPYVSPDPRKSGVALCAGLANGPSCEGSAGSSVSVAALDFVPSSESEPGSLTNPHVETPPLAVVARRAPYADLGAEGRLTVLGAMVGRQQSTAVGGDAARVFSVQGPFVVDAFYKDTRITVTSQRDSGPVTSTVRMAGTSAAPFLEAAGVRSVVMADKPVAVLPTSNGLARALPAKPVFLVPDVLPAQYRGYLLDVAAVGGDPVFLNGQPGQLLELPVTVRNLSRWNGAPLVDGVKLQVTATPASWGGQAWFEGDGDLPALGAAPATAVLRIQLPTAGGVLQDDGQVAFTVTGQSEGNPAMRSGFAVVVSSRQVYKVEASFGNVGDTVTKVHALRLQPGAEREIPFLVHNLGSATDRFRVSLPPGVIGWQAQVVQDGRPVQEVELAAGDCVQVPDACAELALRLTAPSAGQSKASLTLPIAVQSLGSASAADTLLLTARLSQREGLNLTSDPEAVSIRPGKTVRFPVVLHNTGGAAESVSLALDATMPATPGWVARFEESRDGTYVITPGHPFDVAVLVTAPADAPARELVPLLVRVQATGPGATARDAIGLAALVEPVHDLRAAPLADAVVRAGGRLDGRVKADNQGNGPESVHLVAVALPGNWTFNATAQPKALDAGEGADLPFVITIPKGEPPGLGNVTLAAVTADGTSTKVTLRVTVAVEEVLAWRIAPKLTLAPGASTQRLLLLENNGNRAETVALTVAAPAGWGVTVAPASFPIARGGVRSVAVNLTAGPDAQSGDLLVTAQAGIGRAVAKVPLTVEAPGLAFEDLVVPGPPAPGAVGFLTVTLRNLGSVPVEDVHVRLLAGDAQLDDVRFASVGPNGTLLAPLRWVQDELAPPDRIEWGRGDGADYQPIASHSFVTPSAADGKSLTPAAPWPFLLAALGLAAALARRRPA